MTTRERIVDLESSLPVEELTVKKFGKDFQVYPWLKGRLFHKIITGKETNQKQNLRLYFDQIRSLFYGLHHVFRKYDIWAFSNSLERRKIDGKYTDKLFDPVEKYTGKRLLLWEMRIIHFYPMRKIASDHAVSRSILLLFEELYAKLFLRTLKVTDEDLLNHILKSVDGGVDHKWLIRKYLAQYKVMSCVLRVLPNPKLVMLTVGYTHFGYIRAFHERGIKVVEVQHGIISSNHHGYCYEKSLDSAQFPDILLTNGERELKVFDQANLFPVKVIQPVGNFIIDYYAGRVTNQRIEVPRILFTLQDGKMGLKFLEFILSLRERAEGKIEILIQPRRTDKKTYCLELPECATLDFSNEDFYSTITFCQLHSTVYSTTAIESLSLGVPNILVNIDGQSEEQLATILGDNPYSRIVDSPDQFLIAVEELKRANSSDIRRSNTSCYKPGYKENISNFLDEIFNEHE